MTTPAAVTTPDHVARARRLLATAGWPADLELVPPPPAHEGEPQPTVDDPAAGDYYCGALRQRQQLEQDLDAGVEHPWPWCRNRAGWGSDHPRVGLCKLHGGSTASGKKSAALRYAELQAPAVAAFAQIMADPAAPYHARLRAAENIADRGGSPRRAEIDVDTAKRTVLERLAEIQRSRAAQS